MLAFINKYKTAILLLLLLVIVYFPLFLHLEYMPIRMWDESILGVNAIEMAHNRHYFVTYFFGEPDMSNCKPPLMIWCILGFSKILGFSELSLRLPSAIAGLILCVCLFFLIKNYTGKAVYAFTVVLVLVTCQGYIRNHVTRTGEYDSLLVLFSALFSLHLFFAAESSTGSSQQGKHLLWSFIFLTLAVLTKGVACVMLLPGLIIYVFIRRKAIAFLRDKYFYVGLGIFIILGIGFYFLRESQNPGYLKAVWLNELGGRFASTLEGHDGPLTFYLNELCTWQFIEYTFLLPAALLVGLRFSAPPVRRLVLFAVITGSMFLLFISVSQTKLAHYDAPLFPYLAIIIATLFYFIYCLIRNFFAGRTNYIAAACIAFACLLSLEAKAYSDIIARIYFPHGDSWEEGFSVSCQYFQDVAHKKIKNYPYKLVFLRNWGYAQPTVLKCYAEELQQLGYSTQIVTPKEVWANDTLLIFSWDVQQQLEQKFSLEKLEHLKKYDADVVCVKERGQ